MPRREDDGTEVRLPSPEHGVVAENAFHVELNANTPLLLTASSRFQTRQSKTIKIMIPRTRIGTGL